MPALVDPVKPVPQAWSYDWAAAPADPISVALAWCAFLVLALMLGDYLRNAFALLRAWFERWIR